MTYETALRKRMVRAGSTFYANCPHCERTNWLSWEKEGINIICRECGKWFQIGPDAEE